MKNTNKIYVFKKPSEFVLVESTLPLDQIRQGIWPGRLHSITRVNSPEDLTAITNFYGKLNLHEQQKNN